MKILRIEEVARQTGLSTSSIYKQIRLGLFPKGVKLTARATGWDEAAVQQWLEAKLGEHIFKRGQD
jgi:prophage regulatory protein